MVGQDFTISSWAGLNLASISFGPVLGKAPFIRRAIQADCEEIVYLMPATSDSDVDLVIILSTEKHDTISRDPIWKRIADRLG